MKNVLQHTNNVHWSCAPQVLCLRRNAIGIGAGTHLGAALSHPDSAITTLYLSDNKLETEGVLEIAHALSVSVKSVV